jgi:Ca2+:H+ antiporter
MWAGFALAAFFSFGGAALISPATPPLLTAGLFALVFGAMLWLAFGVVHHAECLAEKLGEPYGTLILTLAVISIEVVMISALMLHGDSNPTLARDTMFSVLMIVLNGMVGITLLIGGIRHHTQEFNLEGARSYLSVILCLAMLCLALPAFTDSGETHSGSPLFHAFLVAASVALYGVFLFLQSTGHRAFYQQPGAAPEEPAESHGAGPVWYHALFLLLTMLPIVLLSKKVAALLEIGLSKFGAPEALTGFFVALLVLSPEGLAACHAALQNRLQRTINIALGSALATIGLTVPSVLLVGWAVGQDVSLGLGAPELVLLAATMLCALANFGGTRTNKLAGIVHLVLFAGYVVLIFD